MNIPKLSMILPLLGVVTFAYAQSVNPDGSVTVTFPVETVVRCMNQGGCAMLTAMEITQIQKEAANSALKEYCSKGS